VLVRLLIVFQFLYFISHRKSFVVQLRILFQPEDFEEIMRLAIIEDHVDFVRLSLDNGVSLKEFLTHDRLLDLYNDEVGTLDSQDYISVADSIGLSSTTLT